MLADRALADWPGETPVAAFLLAHPEHRGAVRRAQISAFAPYSEIRDNLIDAALCPLDLVRATLAFMGATDLVARDAAGLGCLVLAGAPCPGDPAPGAGDLWPYRAALPGRLA
jgi:hypothetical protein